ncbi:Predicted acetyltransferase [Evansella caseinilytica]|uniref:Predicted acetyltransferase n=1 Tax=Evansella caseinilytica TaxID=1503961 RepID=A0A1H3H0R1_9BACI|nr:GNAT family N-acetyltransferase [Evansella caseinilytica]SDY08209.1 Predicted acetyltransferase [Evansella caseinilytica]
MIIRKLKNSEIDYSMEMSEYAFQYQLTEEERAERRPIFDPETTLVAEEDGQILSRVVVFPLQVYVHGRKIMMGGVSGVATWPEHRRGGLVKELLYESLKEMKEKGQLLSFLAPFSIPFYRKFGWELFAEVQKISLTKEQLPERKKTPGYVKRVEKDSSLLDTVYHQWATRFNGTLVRDKHWWKRLFLRSKKRHVAVYYSESGEAKGYLIYEVKSQSMTVAELIWLDNESRDGLLTFIANHDSMITKAEITTTLNDGLPFILPDPKVERQLTSYFMARIVDVKAFLEKVPFRISEGDSTVVLHVSDKFCQWNDGTYFLHSGAGAAREGKVEFYPTAARAAGTCQHQPKRGLHLSVQTLTAILFNSQSVDVMMREGYITGDEAAAQQLKMAIPAGQQPFIYDFF